MKHKPNVFYMHFLKNTSYVTLNIGFLVPIKPNIHYTLIEIGFLVPLKPNIHCTLFDIGFLVPVKPNLHYTQHNRVYLPLLSLIKRYILLSLFNMDT